MHEGGTEKREETVENKEIHQTNTMTPSHKDDDGSASFCPHCKGIPCDWDVFGNDLLVSRRRMSRRMKRAKRGALEKALYQLYYYLKNGQFECHSRFKFPSCVLHGLKKPEKMKRKKPLLLRSRA